MSRDEKIGALIIGADFQALGVVRSLNDKGVPVFLLEHEQGISRYSRYVSRMAKNYSLLSNGNFPQYLIDLAKNEGLKGWVLFPNNDQCVRLLSLYRDEIKGWYRNPVPAWDIVQKFYYKEAASKTAEDITIPTPRLYKGSSIEEYLKQELRFPLVLKPSFKENYYPKTKKKAIRIDDLPSFEREFRSMCQIIEPSEIVVQEMIEGGPKNLYSCAVVFDGKKILAGLSARRLRQHPMDFGHATTYAESVNLPELETLTTKLLRAIHYSGIAEVEFMKDERDGLFKFIEINGRPWGWHTLTRGAGINLPYVLYQYMTGKKIQPIVPQEGVKWIRMITDVPTVFKEVAGGRMTLQEYFRSLKGKKEFAVLSWKDPLPFFAEFLLIPYLWKKRGF